MSQRQLDCATRPGTTTSSSTRSGRTARSPTARADRRRTPEEEGRRLDLDLSSVARERQSLRHRVASPSSRARCAARRLRYTSDSSGLRARSAPSAGSRGNAGRWTGSRHGLVLSCLGDPGPFTYKRSRRGEPAGIDRVAANVLAGQASRRRVNDWFPYGGDERQFCSPGFDLPSAPSRARRPTSSRNTTRRPTISTSCARGAR